MSSALPENSTTFSDLGLPPALEAVGAPIRSQASGDKHRVRIDLPDGIEFEIAEIGRRHIFVSDPWGNMIEICETMG